jgi:hypothetical protein
MTIETKHNKGDSVFVIFDNEVFNRIVKSIHIDVSFAEPIITYIVEICGGSYKYKEQHVFATKEELIKSL